MQCSSSFAAFAGKYVSYEYDSWGNLISMQDTSGINIGTINPIRYRGYYFDEETGLYYLQSRYYDPQVGRFINADGYISTGQGIIGNNMFAYCNNNPVNNSDPLGLWTIGYTRTFNSIFGLGVSFSLGYVLDDKGNFARQFSYAIPGINDTVAVGGVGYGAGLAIQYTNADTIYDLRGTSTCIGASVGAGLCIGGDIITFSNISDPEVTFNGFQFSVGYGGSVDVHVIKSDTVLIEYPMIGVNGKIRRKSYNYVVPRINTFSRREVK